MKTCRTCKVEKSEDEFYKTTGSSCKTCHNASTPEKKAWAQNYYKKNYKRTPEQREHARQYAREYNKKLTPEQRRANSLKSAYGLTLEMFDAMMKKQKGLCANPGCKIFLLKPHVDHCHTTGKVRGLLCHGCNISLGMLKECTNRMKGLIKYKRKFS